VVKPVRVLVTCFSAKSRTGKTEVTGQFTDKITNSPTSWYYHLSDELPQLPRILHRCPRSWKIHSIYECEDCMNAKTDGYSYIRKIQNFICVNKSDQRSNRRQILSLFSFYMQISSLFFTVSMCGKKLPVESL